jgi:alkanesulfonate monooxygenase SsuD/methylene tetrahydromethanopterin reductase-like flavin-dependent oxidoreductase (luciferase family)
VRFGFISLGENGYPGVDRSDRAYYREYLALAELLDELDYHSLWVGEHHFGHIASISSPLTFLGAIASRTARIQLGTAVNVASFHHPVRLAEDYATLDQVSDGRAQFGLGTGYAKGEFAGLGADVDQARARFREVMACAAHALTTGRTGFQGELYEVPDLPLVPEPVQRPFPLHMAVLGSASSVDYAAEHGYHLLTSSQSQALTGRNLPETVARYRSRGAAHGHHDLLIKVPFFMLCSRDEEEIAAEFPKMVGYWQHLATDLERGLPEDLRYWETLKDKFSELTVEELHNRQTAFGRPETLVRLFLEVAAAGVDELLVEPFYGPQSGADAERNLRLFREEVMPYVDERFGGPRYAWDGERTVLVQEAANKLPDTAAPAPVAAG